MCTYWVVNWSQAVTASDILPLVSWECVLVDHIDGIIHITSAQTDSNMAAPHKTSLASIIDNKICFTHLDLCQLTKRWENYSLHGTINSPNSKEGQHKQQRSQEVTTLQRNNSFYLYDLQQKLNQPQIKVRTPLKDAFNLVWFVGVSAIWSSCCN